MLSYVQIYILLLNGDDFMSGISVQEAINVLENYGVKVVAGKKGLKNEIKNVSVLEIPQIEDIWINGGELILTTLYAFEEVSQVLKMISAFSRLKVAALGVHPGVKNKANLDKRIIERADELGFPIFILPRDMPYTTIFSIILGNILNKQAVLLTKSEQINRYLTNILLEGGGVNHIGTSLSNILKKPVVILDEFLMPVGRCPYNDSGEIILKAFDSGNLDETVQLLKNEKINEKINYYKNSINFKVKIEDKVYNQVVQKVTFEKDNLGYILLWEDFEIDEYEKNLDILGLTHAATALALNEVKKRAIIETEKKLNFDFYDDLLNENFETEESLIKRANYLGVSIKGKHEVFIVDIDDFEKYYLKNYEKGEEHIQFIKKELHKIITLAIRKNNHENIIIPKSDSFIVFLHTYKNIKKKTLKQKILSITQLIHDEIKSKLPEITVSIGIGNYYSTLMELPKSYEEAKKSIYIGRKIYGNGKVTFYSELGIYGFLVCENINELKMNCDNELEKIVSYGGKDNTHLLETLEAFFDLNESLIAASKKLYIHPNTVKYRIDRVKEIIGEEVFENSEAKLKIHLALKMRKVNM